MNTEGTCATASEGSNASIHVQAKAFIGWSPRARVSPPSQPTRLPVSMPLDRADA